MLKAAITARRAVPRTPLNADGWDDELSSTGLISRYPHIPRSIRIGFNIGIRPITTTFTPENRDSIRTYHREFKSLVDNERALGRYYGPFTRDQVEEILGPFQTSPFSLIPKPHKPESLRLIQNLSYPYPTSRVPHGISSINSTIVASDYPCTWGTFFAVTLMLAMLPPNSQIAVRDISEAFRSIPLHASQWPGAVTRTGDNEFDMDICAMFGGSSCVGGFGEVADAGADIMRARGIGPLVKWVDDHFFARILREYLAELNARRNAARARIEAQGGRRHIGGRIWWEGGKLPDDQVEEFVEDFVFPLRDLSSVSARSPADVLYSYAFSDIDDISSKLGTIWSEPKDQAFAERAEFSGFDWNLHAWTVSLTTKKRVKYLGALERFTQKATHPLKEVQSLYGKLYYTSLILPAGRPYLTHLEAAMALGAHHPYVPRAPYVTLHLFCIVNSSSLNQSETHRL